MLRVWPLTLHVVALVQNSALEYRPGDRQASRLNGSLLSARWDEAHLRVRVRAQVAAEEGLGAVQVCAQLVCVGQVAIVDEVDAQRAVHEEGLGLLCCEGPGCRVPDMANARRACQAAPKCIREQRDALEAPAVLFSAHSKRANILLAHATREALNAGIQAIPEAHSWLVIINVTLVAAHKDEMTKMSTPALPCIIHSCLQTKAMHTDLLQQQGSRKCARPLHGAKHPMSIALASKRHGAPARLSSVFCFPNTSLTRPLSLCSRKRCQSVVTMPALSCPRC